MKLLVVRKESIQLQTTILLPGKYSVTLTPNDSPLLKIFGGNASNNHYCLFRR